MAEPQVVATRCLYRGDRFRLDRDRVATVQGLVERDVIHHPGAVAILAQPTPQSLLLGRQWRYSLRRETLEIPAGTCVPGEDPVATARRELAEECGLGAGSLDELLRYHPAVGVSDELCIIYRARHLRPAPGRPDHGELIAAEVLPLSALPGLVQLGLICDAKTLLALALLGIPPC